MESGGLIRLMGKVLPNGNYDGMPIVEELPDGDITEYRYVNGEYVHDPLPVPEEEHQPTQEERITALEAALTAIEEGIANV